MKRWMETRQVLDELDACARAGRRAALATLIRVRGSAYRREGAKLLVVEDGSTTGNISGGCLEQDVREAALVVTRSGVAERRRYCSGDGEGSVWDLGLGCEGEIDVFIEPASEARPAERTLLGARTPFALCTVVAGHGAPVGRRLVVTAATVEGSLGSATLNAAVAARARALIGEGGPALERVGDCELFFESLSPQPRLVICGAGDDARPLARLGADVGFQVVMVDRRSALLTEERFPPGILCVTSDGERLLERLPLDDSCYVVVMAHKLADDREYVRSLLGSPVPYIGVLGPRQRTERLLAGLRDHGAERDGARGRVYGPVGLDIGAEGAEQVALAVLAEILAVRAGRRPMSLREREGPISGPARALEAAAPAS
ncbi:MAG: XdhC family protein [Gemmatimonadaceae bacterium]